MVIAIINQPLKNHGDEAAHKAFVRQLAKKLPEVSFEVLFLNSNKIDIDSMNVHIQNVKYVNCVGINKAVTRFMRWSLKYRNLKIAKIHPLLARYMNILKKYDYVICAPGGICMGGFMSWSHVWQLYVATSINKPIAYWSRSIGPFTELDKEHKLFKIISEELIKQFDYIGLRDIVSYKLANKYRDTCKLVVDSVFLEKPENELIEKIKNDYVTSKYMVFVPNQLKWHYKYENILQEDIDEFYLKILECVFSRYPNITVLMLPQLYNTDRSDYKYFISLKEKSSYKDKIVIVDENINSNIQQSVIANAEFVIGARYHSVIFAINNEVPFISLSYEHKMRGILELLELQMHQVDIEEIFSDRELYKEALANVTQILCNIERMNVCSKKAEDIIQSALLELISSIEGSEKNGKVKQSSK